MNKQFDENAAAVRAEVADAKQESITAYDKEQSLNEIQRILNRRKIERAMAERGLSSSGVKEGALARAEQASTALNRHYDTAEKQTVRSIEEQGRAILSEQETGRKNALATIDRVEKEAIAAEDKKVDDKAQELYNKALNARTALISCLNDETVSSETKTENFKTYINTYADEDDIKNVRENSGYMYVADKAWKISSMALSKDSDATASIGTLAQVFHGNHYSDDYKIASLALYFDKYGCLPAYESLNTMLNVANISYDQVIKRFLIKIGDQDTYSTFRPDAINTLANYKAISEETTKIEDIWNHVKVSSELPRLKDKGVGRTYVGTETNAVKDMPTFIRRDKMALSGTPLNPETNPDIKIVTKEQYDVISKMDESAVENYKQQMKAYEQAFNDKKTKLETEIKNIETRISDLKLDVYRNAWFTNFLWQAQTTSGTSLPALSFYTGSEYINQVEISELEEQLTQKQNELAQVKMAIDYNELNSVTNSFSENYDENFWEIAEKGEQEGLSTSGWWDTTAKDNIVYLRNNPNRLDLKEKVVDNTHGIVKSVLANDMEYLAAKYMTDSEYKIYTYYLGLGDDEKRLKYLDTIEQELKVRQGKDMADDVDVGLESLVFGIDSGFDQFTQGLVNLFNTDDYIPVSGIQVASSVVKENMKDYYGFFGQVSYDIASLVGNLLPSVATSAAIGALNPAAGVAAGLTLTAASSAGNAYAEMINSGYSNGQARTYSTLNGISEAALQYALGGIGKLGGKAISKVLPKAVSIVDNGIAKFAIKWAGRPLAEGFEESVQEVLGEVYKNAVSGKDIFDLSEVDWGDVMYTFLLGSISGGVFEGIEQSRSLVKGSVIANKYYGNSKSDMQSLVTEGCNMPKKTVANFIANKYQKVLKDIGRLSGTQLYYISNAIQLAILNLDALSSRLAISARLSQLGVKNNVPALADGMYKALSGDTLSYGESKLLSQSKVVGILMNKLGQIGSEGSSIGLAEDEKQQSLLDTAFMAGLDGRQNSLDIDTENGKIKEEISDTAYDDLIAETAQFFEEQKGKEVNSSSDLDGIRIINKKYAHQTYALKENLAKKYGYGIKFSEEGFPDFEPYCVKKCAFDDLCGYYYFDAKKANASAGYNKTPKGYTWHHVEDGRTLILIPTELHKAVPHTGGASLIRHGRRP